MDKNETKTGDNPAIDLAAITKSVTESLTKTLTERYDKQFEELSKNVGVLADTLKNALPATATAEEKKDEKKSDPITTETVAKIVADQLAAANKAQTDDAAKKAARAQLVEKVTKEKLGGDADLASFLTGDDEASINASADKLATKWRSVKPDFGGAQKDGGETPGTNETPVTNGNLTPGVAAYAKSLKLPA